MFCTKCGKEIDDNATFCIHCGESVTPVNNQDSFFNQNTQGANPNNQGFQPNNQGYQPNNQGYNQYNQGYNPATQDAPSAGFAWLCFFFPIVGLVLYILWKDQYPLKAKSCGKGALIGVIVGFISGILWGILLAALGANGYNYYNIISILKL